MPSRFALLRFPLTPFAHQAAEPPEKLRRHLERARYPFRLLRYWWAASALAREAERLGRPLVVVDLGCERGWLRHFTPTTAVARWIGLDWNPRAEARAGYDEVLQANFDGPLPLGDACADAVVSLHVFEHLPRPGVTLGEAARLLRPGGIFLGCTPTMPGPLARLRERYFRRCLREGRITPGGHITVLSPGRWRQLVGEFGLEAEFVTGSHALRWSGAWLENSRAWVRFNQLWAALFPSLGSECCLQARRPEAVAWQAARLVRRDHPWRWRLAGLGATAALALLAGLSLRAETDPHREAFVRWLNAHQKGGDTFVFTSGTPALAGVQRSDVIQTATPAELEAALVQHPHAHVLVSLATARSFLGQFPAGRWSVDSWLEIDHEDYLMLRATEEGTPLEEYLLGASDSPMQTGGDQL